MSSSLVVTNLSAWYGDRENRTEVFQSVSFRVEAGTILGLFGPNGCGKTTLLKVVAGLKTSAEGTVQLPIRDEAVPSVATIPQDFRSSFFEWANLQNNLVLTSSLVPSQPQAAIRSIRSVSAEMGLGLDLSLRPNKCSGGMLQQAALIRAFQNDPDLILADEPFSALDVNIAARVRASFRSMVKNRGIAAVVVLHQLQDLVEVCDEVLVIAGRPFSTDALFELEQAVVIKNEILREVRHEESRVAFVALAERVLGNSKKHGGSL